jgi:two-component system alkaline phosphatase synthesis response regulator PhoP
LKWRLERRNLAAHFCIEQMSLGKWFSMKAKILVVDDQIGALTLIGIILERGGFEVLKAIDARRAVALLDEVTPDLIIADVMLPDMDGIELCRQLRDRQDTQNTPLLLLSARHDSETILRGIEAGATDYISKPILHHDLAHKVRMMLENNANQMARVDVPPKPSIPARTPFSLEDETESPPRVMTLGALTIYFGRYQIHVRGQVIDLTPAEYDLLVYVAAHRGQPVSCQELAREVRGLPLAEAQACAIIRPHFSNLRRKLREVGQNASLIENENRLGYRIGIDVK